MRSIFMLAVAIAFAAVTGFAQLQFERPILFSSTRDGNSEIYRMNEDGSGQTRLTNGLENDRFAEWMPGGSRIVWLRNVNPSTGQVWVMDADGGNPTLISGVHNVQLHYGPSPDGNRILFGVRAGGGTVQLWSMDLDGSDKLQLTDPPAGIEDHTAAWSPDGQKIAFGRCDPLSFVCDVWAVNADGTGAANLTPNNASDDDGARFTPDGRIVFGRQEPNYNVYVMNPDGTDQHPVTNFQGADALPGDVSPDGTGLLVRQVAGTLSSNEIILAGLYSGSVANITNNSAFDLNGVWSPKGERVAFNSRRDVPTDEIYVMNADGSNVVRLTNNAAADTMSDWYRPRLEPDGRLLFSSFRTGNQEIFTTNSDGTAIQKLTSSPSIDGRPVWSPDGSKFLFYSERDDLSGDIYVVDADGTNAIRLTANNALQEYSASWSPDGSMVVFGAHGPAVGSGDIYVMNADGSGLQQLTFGGGDEFNPIWSPNGKSIAFASDRDEPGNVDIYLTDANGTGIERLTTSPGADVPTDWSKDGLRLLISSDRDGDTEVYWINADGTGPVRLTFNTGGDFAGAYSPDGTRIAFTREENGNSDIYTMNADGTGIQRITFDAAADTLPDWQPIFDLLTISGQVRTASGTPISGAKVSVRNAFGMIRKVDTDGAGNFDLGYLAPGATYRVEVKVKKEKFDPVEVTLNDNAAGLIISAK